MTSTIDNGIYDRMADTWWDDTGFLSLLRTSLNPVRFGYFSDILLGRPGMDPARIRALDIGCGGGLLAEEFARLGCHVTGIDPSVRSIEAARAHAAESGLAIDYQVGTGEDLPFEDSSFDVVYCCDVLEHVTDLDAVIAETARVLKPGGIYFYDTINRTVRSRLVFIKLYQEWEWSSFMPPNAHDWDMFIRPDELKQNLERHGIEHRDIAGIVPGVNPLSFIRLLRAAKRGTVPYATVGERAGLHAGKDISVSYMGYGIRAGAPPPA